MMDWLLSDDEIVMSEAEEKAVRAILASDCRDVVDLIGGAGYDVAVFFEYGDWENIDFRGSDVAGVSFKGAIMTGAIMYRDQYEAIQKSAPRILDKILVQEGRGESEENIFTVISGKPLDPAEARADFRAALGRMLSEFNRGGKYVWAEIIPFIHRLDTPQCRCWALDLVLDRVTGLPSGEFIEACRRGDGVSFQPGTVRNESLAVSLLNVISLNSTSDRLQYLGQIYGSGARIEQRLQSKVAELMVSFDDLRQAIDVAVERRWLIDDHFFGSPRFVRSVEDVREMLKLMSSTGVAANIRVFHMLADNTSNTMDVVDRTLALMSEFAIPPDVIMFSKFAQRARTEEDIRRILTLMSESNVRPDTNVFSKLADGAKGMPAVRALLESHDRGQGAARYERLQQAG